MKKLIFPILTMTLAFLFSNCEKEKDPLPDYVGKWGNSYINYGPIGMDTLYPFYYNSQLVITESTYEKLEQIKYETFFVTIISETGQITVDEESGKMSFVIETIGESAVNNSGRFTGNLSETDLTNYPVVDRSYQRSYELNDDNDLLIIDFRDYNMDGDFDDFDEYDLYFKRVD